MKYLISLFFLFPLQIFGQPVPTDQQRFETIDTITRRLKEDPDNDILRWKRVNLIFNQFRVEFNYKDRCVEDTVRPKPDRYTVLNRDNTKRNLSYNGIYVINELNLMINNKASFMIGSIDANHYDIYSTLDKNPSDTIYAAPACLYFKRGEYYDARGIDSLAIKDYLTALSYNPPKGLKESICFNLAANYYHQFKQNAGRQIPDSISLNLSLKYIDAITPIVYESQPRQLERYSGVYPDKYEREKILLLKETKNSRRLVAYLGNLTVSYFRLYLAETLKPEYYQKEHSFSIAETLKAAKRYLEVTLEYVSNLDDADMVKRKFFQDLSDALMKQ